MTQDEREKQVRRFAEELRKWWSFDDGQMHTHSWHSREDFIERKLPGLLASLRSPSPVGLGEEEIAAIKEALDVARNHVVATHAAEHMMDGFGPARQRPSDSDLAITDEAIAILSRLSQTPAPAGGGGEHRVGDYIADYSMPTREQINAPDPELDALLRRSIIASSEPAPELMTPAPSPMVTEEEAMHVFCNAANLHLTCSYPECKCKIHPTGVRALLALLREA